MIGKTVSHYRIEEKIGAGGMGEIYLAEDTRLNRKVALKFLPESLSADPEARERLLREAQAASRLAHPNILTVFAVEHDQGRDFIAMEYIAGATLNRAAEQKSWSIDDLIEIAVQIADGLRSAHEAEIVHRDLKPSNILIDREGRARILDFGIAKVKGASKLTKTGSTMGTVSYLSPEQAQGKDVDARSDLFSFGAILYELIAGRLPFGGEHEAAIVYAIANEEPEPLARFKSNVPDELQRIVTKCLAKDPRERYQSATDLVADLRALRRHQATGTVTPAAAKKGSHVYFAVAALIVVVVGAAVVGTRLFKDTSRATTGRDKIMLAVLPFQNLGGAEDEYLATGITEEILTDLAQIPGLGVISRTSTLKYKDRTQSIKEIGAELGVEYVLEASIQWDKSGDRQRIRLHPQLIRAGDDVHVWAGKFDAVIDDIFEVQTSIAAQVARNLSLALLPAAERAADDRPTENLRAYELYLQAKGFSASDIDDIRNHQKAVELYEQAIRLDSSFALAHAGLARALILLQWGYSDPSYGYRAKSEALRSLELNPDLPQGHVALGEYYNLCERKYAKALEEFSKVQFAGADESDVLTQMGLVRMRQGEWYMALDHFEEAFKHDPLSKRTTQMLGMLTSMMRRYDEALRYADRLISINPEDPVSYAYKIQSLVAKNGRLDEARQVLRDAATFVDPVDILSSDIAIALWELGLTDEPVEVLLDHYQARTRVQPPTDTVAYHFNMARLYRAGGEARSARAHADSARIYSEAALERFQAAIDNSDLDPSQAAYILADLAVALALLGEKERAIETAELAVRTLPVDDCHW